MPDVQFFKGTGENLIHQMDWTPGSDTPVGSVVIIGDTPCVSQTMNPGGLVALANRLTSIRVRGGVYAGIGSGAMTGRLRVYWDFTAKKFTLTAGANKHFGFTAPDTNSADGDTVYVEHDPDGNRKGATQTIAAAGSTQADASLLVEGGNLVTGADGTKGSILPVPYEGMSVDVKNADAANAILKVYPTTGKVINALAANGAISMAAKTSAVFKYVGGAWFTIPLLPS